MTNQPNVLIIPDSYLYLTGDKYKKVYDGDTWTHNVIDETKVSEIKRGGELSIYGQVKVYSDDKLSDVRTIKLFGYNVYNVSDDKPKFLIEKTYDVTNATLQRKLRQNVKIEFSDVLWQIDESQFEFLDGDDNKFRVLNQDVVVVQPIHVNYNWKKDDDFRIRELSFDITNDIIDFGAVPELCTYDVQVRTLRNEFLDSNNKSWREPYYDHWSDNNMSLHFDEVSGIPRLTLTYPDGGYNFDTIYLRWKLPKGCAIMDTLDRLGGYVFSSTASNVVVDCGSTMSIPDVDTTIGHIVVRVKRPDTMYLGLEHSTTKRMNGYVISNLADEIKNALLRGDFNPTLDTSIDETDATDVKLQISVTFDANGGKFNDNMRIFTKMYDIHKELGDLPYVEYVFNEPGDFAQDAEFVGWFTAPEGGEEVTVNTIVREDVTYYAQWTRYLYYENIGGVHEDEEGNVSGFSNTKYLRMTQEINLQDYTFDFVVNATTGDLPAGREQEIIGCSANNKDIEVGTRADGESRFDWEFNLGNYFQGEYWIPQEYTEYYVRLLKDGQNTTCYARTPDSDWVKDFVRENTLIRFPTTKFMFGTDIDVNNQWWSGTINLRKSYIIIDGIKYFFKPKPSN